MRKLITSLKKHWQIIYFAVAVLMMVFGYGLAVGAYQFFPHQIMRPTDHSVLDWKENCKHDVHLRPEKRLHSAHYEGTE